MRKWRAVHFDGRDLAELGLKLAEVGSPAHTASRVTVGTALHLLIPQMELKVTTQDLKGLSCPSHRMPLEKQRVT